MSLKTRLARLEAQRQRHPDDTPPWVVQAPNGTLLAPDGTEYRGPVARVKVYERVSPDDWDSEVTQ